MKVKIILILFIAIPALLYGEEWQIKKSDKNLVKFTSSTPVLDFDGITSEIDGYIYWKGEKQFGLENEIYIEVDLNSVETGIGKRDRDMREDVLETEKWPKTSFRGIIVDLKNVGENNFNVITEGKMFIHGHTKDIKVGANITIQNNLMNVTCEFSVFLKDYEIEAPSLLAFIKVAEEIKLHLNFQLEKYTENGN